MSHQFSASLLDLWSTTPISKTNNSRINFPFSTIGYSEIIYMWRTFIWDTKTTYKSIVCRETDCRQKINRSQICQHDQQLHGNEYNYYLLIIGSAQLNNGESLILAEVEDHWILFKLYKTSPVSPNSFIDKKERKETQNREVFYSSLPLSHIF